MGKVLITGANFNNKGAQSMLFITTAEIKKYNPDCEVYFATTKPYDEMSYSFKRVRYDYVTRRIALGDKKIRNTVISIAKDTVKFILHQRERLLWGACDLEKLLPGLDLIVDISGFAVGRKWPAANQENYLDGIRLARRYSVPIVMMPQSFGPFDYDEERKYLLKEISDLFLYPDIIFAREKAGYKELCNTFNLTNVRLSSDLVLQNKGYDTDLVMKKKPVLNVPNIDSQNAVAIIPNKQCFNHGNHENVISCYNVVINELLDSGKDIYIFRHSGEDLEACKEIYSFFQHNKNVYLLENDFTCLEYDEFIKKFEFIVCSRYHGIVHAYRNCIPAIILGWAVKYVELAEQVSQRQYVFNIVDENVDYAKLKEVTRHMIQNYMRNACVIADRLKEIQQENCFDFLKDYI